MVTEKAFVVTANYENFNEEGGAMIMWNCPSKLEAWKLAFYELWRYQMTWSMAYSIDMIDGNSGVFVSILCRESFVEPLVNTMDGLGYGNINKYATKVGMIDCCKVPDDVEEVFISW